MTENRATFASRLRDLALALLNATLMLAVLLVFGAWLLLGRVQTFTAETVGAVAENVGDDLRTRLESQTTRVSDALERVATFDDRLTEVANRVIDAPAAADQAAAAELARLRDDVTTLNATLNALDLSSEAPELAEASARLATLETQLTSTLDRTGDSARNLDSRTAEEVNALRQDVQTLTVALQDIQSGLATLRQETSGSLRGALRQLFLDLADRVAPPGTPAPDTEG